MNLALGGNKVQEAFYIFQELGDKYTWTTRLHNGSAVCSMHMRCASPSQPHHTRASRLATPSSRLLVAQPRGPCLYTHMWRHVCDAHTVRLPLPAPSHSRLTPRNTLQPPAGGAASRSLPLHTHVETVLRPMDLRVRHVASSGCMAAPTWFLIGNYAPAPAVSEKRRLRDPFLTLFLSVAADTTRRRRSCSRRWRRTPKTQTHSPTWWW